MTIFNPLGGNPIKWSKTLNLLAFADWLSGFAILSGWRLKV